MFLSQGFRVRTSDENSDEAESEAYEYFDKNIRPFPRGNNEKIDTNKGGFQNNDVDAFRHAYASGVFTEYKSLKDYFWPT
jgi:hypothetical protein